MATKRQMPPPKKGPKPKRITADSLPGRSPGGRQTPGAKAKAKKNPR